MPKGYNRGNTGTGKTLWASLYALEWIRKHPNGHIFANYHLNLPNFTFSPNMFLDFRKLEECLIIFDDISNLEMVVRFIKVTANRSRKKQLELIFLAQYKKMIAKQLRSMSDYRVITKYNKVKDELTVIIRIREKGRKTIIYKDAVKTVKALNLYDTNEVVDDPTESEIIEEIIKLSKTKKDVEKNLMIYSGNKAERKQLLKEILKKMNLQEEDQEEDDDITYMRNAILRYRYGYEWLPISLKSGIKKTTLIDNINRVCNEINQEYLS